MAEERPQAVQGEVSTGQVIEIGVLDWGGYKKLKPKMVQRLASRVGDTLGDLEGKSEAEIMAPMLVALDEILVDLPEEFVAACVRDKKTLNKKLRPVDWLKLREAAAKVNDLAEILELEKNALMASVQAAVGMMSGVNPLTEVTGDGG